MDIRLLGPVEVHGAAGAGPIGGVKPRALLATLALAARRVVPVGRLIAAGWDENPPSSAVAQVHSVIFRLRRALETVEPDAGKAIERHGDGYLLTVSRSGVDALVFEDLLAAAHTATDSRQRADLLRQGLRLWRGEPLAGAGRSRSIRAMAARLAEEHLQAVEDRVEADLTLGRHSTVVGELAELTARHPLRERLVGLSMLALYRCGRQSDALAVYDVARKALAEELGVDPGVALAHRFQQVLHRDPQLDPPATALVTRQDTHPRQEGGGRALAQLPPDVRGVPQQLPAAPARFVGRDRELAVLNRAMAGHAEHPSAWPLLITISGTGGIGKTWLTVHWATLNLDRFPDGQLYIDLAGFGPASPPTPPDVAIRGFMHALGADPAGIPENPDALRGMYRSLLADRRLLLVLDNARDAAQVVPLLPASPTCTVLVTSRNRLSGLLTAHGAQPLPLGVLDGPAAHRVLTRYLGSQRLTAEPEAVAELLAYCAGLPLALGIVAARALTHPHLPLARWAMELRDARTRLGQFDDGDPATNLKTVLSWSYAALPAQQAKAFGLLGLAPGPDISLAAAGRLTSLSGLQASSVLRALDAASLLDQHRPGRYRMHDLVRLHAIEQAHRDQPPSQRAGALRRVAEFYLHISHACQQLINPHRPLIEFDPAMPGPVQGAPADRATGLAWLDTEHGCLLATQQLAAEHGWHTMVWQLAWVLDNVHRRRALLHDNLTTWRAALAAADRLGDPAVQAGCHRLLGAAQSRAQQDSEAFDHLQQALTLATHTGNRCSQAHTHQALAWAWNRNDDKTRALDHASRALDLYQILGNKIGEAEARHTIGWLRAQLGQYGEAFADCEAALTLHRRYDDQDGEAAVLVSLGYLADRTRRYVEALDYYSRALALFRGLGHVFNEPDVLERLGYLHTTLGQHDEARANWQSALQLYRAQHRTADADRISTELTACSTGRQ